MKRKPIRVVVRELQGEASLDVRVAPRGARAPGRKDGLEAKVAVSISNVRLATAMARAIKEGLHAVSAVPPVPSRIVRFRSRKSALALGVEALTGAIAVVDVTQKNARFLPEIVDAIRAANALGVHLVWDGREPDRTVAEQPVFTVLERTRATPKGPPVVLSKNDKPPLALRLLIAQHGTTTKG